MTHASLAAHYRPQTFAEVTGQQMITKVLSRACAEESIAPAYLLSGTRGVGKTTIARIFAKALNCEHAPTSEPCNKCSQCLKITQGNHVDVTEIDGASNNSVDDARALREHIGYAAMEGRYKVFIIDEAHMLSRNAFNALLKTLEEPPPRVVFIFATTEAHKFPITIVSRCQHFIFKRLAEDELMEHLCRVLTQEKVEYEQSALQLIARRAAGSVRDGMSLLGQSLALGEKVLNLENTRMVLGLAGQEFFESLMRAIAQNDCQEIVELSKVLGEQGIDIGFFLRELTNLWRTLFLLREAGANILPVLNLSFDEAKLWSDIAPIFSTTHLHAAWHMTLDAQRKVIHSPEPAAALELLLLNLALMPRLLPLERVGTAASANINGQVAQQIPQNDTLENVTAKVNAKPNTEVKTEDKSFQRAVNTSQPFTPSNAQASISGEAQANMPDEALTQSATLDLEKKTLNFQDTSQSIDSINSQLNIIAEPTWEDLCALIMEHGVQNGKDIVPNYILQQAKGVFTERLLSIGTMSGMCYSKMEQARPHLEALCAKYCGKEMEIKIEKPKNNYKPESVLKQEFAAREDMQDCLKILDATILHVSSVTN